MEIKLLDAKKVIANLVKDDVHSSILKQIKKDLSKDEFNFVVTSENVKFARDKMAVLNKSKDFIDTFRKDKVSSESVAIDTFKTNVKEYLALIETKREEIKKNVSVFERETKDKITKELSLYTDEAIKNANLRYDFTNVDTADLIVLGSVTPKGALTKGAKETIDGRVLACKSKQDKYDMRLMDLENQSHRAKLEATLTITHVQGIIFLDDDTEYQTKLDELIASEIERQNIVKANIETKAKEDAAREAQQKVINEQNRIASMFNDIATDNELSIDGKITMISSYDFSQLGQFESFARAKGQSVISELNNFKKSLEPAQKSTTVTVNDKKVEVAHETIPKDTPKVEDGKKIVRINAIFEVEVPGHVPSEAVLNKVRDRLSECDINSDTLKSLEVV